MNGIHDCGGMEGLGPIILEKDEPVFRADWERRVFALLWAAGYNGFWNLDELRHAIERMPAVEYLQSPYYEHWLHGMETLLIEKRVIEPAELSSSKTRDAANAPAISNAPMTVAAVEGMIANGFSMKKAGGSEPLFKTGDRVRTKRDNPHGHTRLPRYARGKVGIVQRDHGVFPFNDTNAHGSENPQHVYLVRFAARELWGEGRSEKDAVLLDLWEQHLEPAQ